MSHASSHRTDEGGDRHAIKASEFTDLVGEQLRQNAYQHCVALDPNGFKGKIGAMGVLFKLELAPCGYTFVGKGTYGAHLDRQHEGRVYSRLERLQGQVVLVHLGLVDLAKDKGYAIPGGTRIVHMMLMSWAGELAADAPLSERDLKAETKRSAMAVWDEGVNHGDMRDPNILWNEECRRVMIIDFDRLPSGRPSSTSNKRRCRVPVRRNGGSLIPPRRKSSWVSICSIVGR